VKKNAVLVQNYMEKKLKPLLDSNQQPKLPYRMEVLVFNYYPTSSYAMYFRMNVHNIIHVFKVSFQFQVIVFFRNTAELESFHHTLMYCETHFACCPPVYQAWSTSQSPGCPWLQQQCWLSTHDKLGWRCKVFNLRAIFFTIQTTF
jgi:hypothetical protein